MEYRLSITFVELGCVNALIDRLLTNLLEEMPEAGPAISQDIASGEMTITLAFESAQPTWSAHDISRRLDDALTRIGAPPARMVLYVHLEAVVDDEGIPDSRRPALQPV